MLSIWVGAFEASAQPAARAPAPPGQPAPEASPYPEDPPSTALPTVNDEARDAFDGALAAEAAGAIAEACVSFRRSLALVRELGPLRKVASCDAREGKLLSAQTLLAELLRRLPEGDPDRGLLIAQLDAVTKRIAHLELRLLPGAPAGMAVRVDGVPVTLPVADMALDPGQHQLVIDLPGKPPELIPLELAEGAMRSVNLPTPQDQRAVPVPSQPSRSDLRPLWVSGWVAGSVGLAGFVVAGVTGAKLIGDEADFDECVATPGCDSQAVADSAGGLLSLNAIAWGIGAVGVSVGATLLIVDAAQGDAGSDVKVEASVGPGNASLRLRF